MLLVELRRINPNLFINIFFEYRCAVLEVKLKLDYVVTENYGVWKMDGRMGKETKREQIKV